MITISEIKETDHLNCDNSHENIIHFIDGFKKYNSQAIIKLFTEGYCYWFTYILQGRFGGNIVMDKHGEHFMIEINNRIYDINGEVKCDNFIYFDQYESIDPTHYKRIIRDCVNKET